MYPGRVHSLTPPHSAICRVLTFETQPRESQSFRTANGFKGHLTVFTQKEIRIRQIGLPKKTQLLKGETGNRILLRTLPSSACRRTPGMCGRPRHSASLWSTCVTCVLLGSDTCMSGDKFGTKSQNSFYSVNFCNKWGS